MYYIRPFQYDCTSRWLYVLVSVALRSVLVTSREYTCVFTFYTCRGAGPCVNFRRERERERKKKTEVRHFIVFTRMEQFVL